MISFTTLKKSPITFAMRTLALAIILTLTDVNVILMPGLLQEVKLGCINDIFMVTQVPGGEGHITHASSEAIKAGVVKGDIVLNPEVYTQGDIGTPVTFLIQGKNKDVPAREVTFIRKSLIPDDYIGTIFVGLPTHVNLYLETALLWGVVIFTGVFSLVAFWLGLDALTAFLFVISFSQLFAVSFDLKWILLSQIFPAATIFFLIYFPSGKLVPRWSWLLIFLPLPRLISNFVFSWIPSSGEAIYLTNIFSPLIILMIFWVIVYWYSDSFTPIQRKRLNWLIFVLVLIIVPRQLLQLHSIARLIPDQGANSLVYNFYMYDVMFFRVNRTIYSVSKTFHYFGTTPTLIFFGVSVYRYLCTFTSIERQQAKWIIFGLILAEAPLMISYMFLAYYYSSFQIDWGHFAITRIDNQAAPVNFVVAIIDKLILLEIVLIALSFLLAIRRVRLSDVDTLINRALVYGGLIMIVGIVCLLTTALIDHTLGKITDAQKALLVISISAFFIILIFKSTRFRLQKLVDKIYRPEEFRGTEN